MMDTATAARAVAGRLIGANVGFTRVSTDTRTLAPGDLYVALAGERFDGHDFIAAAFERGAVAAIVAQDRADAARAAAPTQAMIAVADPLAALGTLAAWWRRQFTLPVIVVVGSNGKTTVKEMIASILRAHFGEDSVAATRGNLNNAIGLPLTLLGLRARHRAAVIELGMNHPGETAELAAIAQATVGLINNAQREHQEFMRSVADVADEHAALVRALPADGAAVLNADDAHLSVWLDAARARGSRIVSFGLERAATIGGTYDAGAGGGRLALTTPAGPATMHLAAFGRHNASNALAAVAATYAIGVPLAAIVAGLEAFRPVAGRLVERATPSGAIVIDDTYNANPDSVRAAIDVLGDAPGERWLALGDMGEVGTQGPAFHREIGEHARARGIDRLYTAGTMAAECAAAFGAGAQHHAEVEALAAELARELSGGARRGLTILVKGSRFMRMERVVRALTGDAGSGGAH